MKKQGKIKAIPVKEVTEGMQLTYNGVTYTVTKAPHNNSNVFLIKRLNLNSTKLVDVTDLNIAFKTLVVIYEDNDWRDGRSVNYTTVQSLPLKHSQWEAAIANNEVDTDKVVNFDIIDVYVNEKSGYKTSDPFVIEKSGGTWIKETSYAKIIPKKKKKESLLVNLENLSNEDLLQIAKELTFLNVSDNALIRDVIKDTEVDTTVPILAYGTVAQLLAQVLAKRLKIEMERK